MRLGLVFGIRVRVEGVRALAAFVASFLPPFLVVSSCLPLFFLSGGLKPKNIPKNTETIQTKNPHPLRPQAPPMSASPKRRH